MTLQSNLTAFTTADISSWPAPRERGSLSDLICMYECISQLAGFTSNQFYTGSCSIALHVVTI